MSSQSDSASAALIALADTLYQANHCVIGSTVFLIYDYVITFGREVTMFWKAPFTGASILFFANRYVTLVWNTMGLAQFAKFSDQRNRLCNKQLETLLIALSCPVYFKVFSAISYSQYIIWAAFSALRAYALGRNRLLAIFVFLLAVAPAGINYSQFYFGLTGVNDPTFGCFADTQMPANVAKKSARTDPTPIIVVIASRTCLITTDTILLVVTWATLGTRDVLSKMKPEARWSLSTIMLRDGILYFLVLLMLNVLHLAFTLSATFGHLISNISIFEDQIIAVLVSRFLLDLQAANRRSLKLNTDDPLHLSSTGSFDPGTGSLAFARVVGSLGEGFIGPGSLGSDEDEDEYEPSDTYWSHGSTQWHEEEGIELSDKGNGKEGDLEAAVAVRSHLDSPQEMLVAEVERTSASLEDR